jgi:putative ATPase
MIDGCDPHYIARRVLRMAAKTSGWPIRALSIAWRPGRPMNGSAVEGELAIAEAVVYMAVAAKDNALYTGLGRDGRCRRYGSLQYPQLAMRRPSS